MKSPKAPKPTAQQLSVERRQAAALDEEIAEQEERARALSRGTLGIKSLLGGVSSRGSRPRAGGSGGSSRTGGVSSAAGSYTGGLYGLRRGGTTTNSILR